MAGYPPGCRDYEGRRTLGPRFSREEVMSPLRRALAAAYFRELAANILSLDSRQCDDFSPTATTDMRAIAVLDACYRFFAKRK